MRHQRILDLAEKQPQASMESIAEEVPSATVELVEHVLEEYGDPAEDVSSGAITESDTGTDRDKPSDETTEEIDSATDQEPFSEQEPGVKTTECAGTHPPVDANGADTGFDHELPNVGDLTDGQKEVLRVVSERPDATQRKIADRLGVSAPTVSNRVNAIDGFDWQHRNQAVETFRAQQANDTTTPNESMATNETNPSGEMDRLEDRIETLETQIAADGNKAQLVLDLDPELLQKLVHACFKSETITEDEELAILKLFLPDDS